jgi:hypothetical protein
VFVLQEIVEFRFEFRVPLTAFIGRIKNRQCGNFEVVQMNEFLEV